MENGRTFGAKWDGQARFMFFALLAALVLLCISAARSIYRGDDVAYTVLGVVSVALMLHQLLHTVWSYRIEGRELVVRRIFWSSRIDLSDLEMTSIEPELLKGSHARGLSVRRALRWVGPMRHPERGDYMSYSANPATTVLLVKKSGMVAVSPKDPAAFVRAVTDSAGKSSNRSNDLEKQTAEDAE